MRLLVFLVCLHLMTTSIFVVPWPERNFVFWPAAVATLLSLALIFRGFGDSSGRPATRGAGTRRPAPTSTRVVPIPLQEETR